MKDLDVNAVLTVANKEVGYKETGTNITKYAKDFDTKWPDFYNGKKQGAEWCDIFVDWCFVTAYGEANALKMLYQPKKSCGAGVTFSYDYYKAKKRTGTKAQVGAQIFFKKTKDAKKPCHTGLVYKVDSKKVYTIEGNKDNQVKKCSYVLNSDKIFGYGYPGYTEKTVSEPVGPGVAIPEPVEKPKYVEYVVTANDGLHIRTGSTILHKSLGVMLKGASFFADNTSKTWYHGYTRLNGKKITGYASSKYLKKK